MTGVCRSEADLGHDPKVFLLLRSPMDVRVISRPGLMRTLGMRVLAAAAILSSAGLAVALWFIQQHRTRLAQYGCPRTRN